MYKVNKKYGYKNIKNVSIITTENKGQGHARNLELKKVSGEYILFLDADDFLENLSLQMAIEKMKKEESDLVLFDWKYYYEETEKYKYI